MKLSKRLLVFGLFICLSCSKTNRTSKEEPTLEFISSVKDYHSQKGLQKKGNLVDARRAVQFIENAYDKESKIMISIRNHKKTATIIVMKLSKNDTFYHTCFESYINNVPVEINLDTCNLFTNKAYIKKHVKNNLLNMGLRRNIYAYQDCVFEFNVIQPNQLASFHIKGNIAQRGDSLFIKK